MLGRIRTRLRRCSRMVRQRSRVALPSCGEDEPADHAHVQQRVQQQDPLPAADPVAAHQGQHRDRLAQVHRARAGGTPQLLPGHGGDIGQHRQRQDDRRKPHDQGQQEVPVGDHASQDGVVTHHQGAQLRPSGAPIAAASLLRGRAVLGSRVRGEIAGLDVGFRRGAGRRIRRRGAVPRDGAAVPRSTELRAASRRARAGDAAERQRAVAPVRQRRGQLSRGGLAGARGGTARPGACRRVCPSLAGAAAGSRPRAAGGMVGCGFAAGAEPGPVAHGAPGCRADGFTAPALRGARRPA